MARANDILVLGADLEGLAAAATLAAAGRSVTVVDSADNIGGITGSWEFHAGHRLPGLLHETALVRRALLDPLGLGGLDWANAEAPLQVFFFSL